MTKLRVRKRIEWTPRLVSRLCEAWDEFDADLDAIAKSLRLPTSKVYEKAKKLGLRVYARTEPRICLTCRRTFRSEGKHNRICRSCRASEIFHVGL